MEQIAALSGTQLFAIFLAAAAVSALLVVTARWHSALTGDHAGSGIQKVHVGSTPRIGLFGLIAGLFAGFVFLRSSSQVGYESADFLLKLVSCSLPVVFLGLIEDLTKKVSPRIRLGAALISAWLMIYFLRGMIPRIGIEWIDQWFGVWWISVPVSMLFIAGFTNAINIIDGLNGLAAGMVMLMLGGTLLVSHRLGDALIFQVSTVIALAVLGFFVVNFPRGWLFLGDGGAYLLGFLLVGVWIAMLRRNPDVSAWFPVALGIYPTVETVFSMYRRRFHRSMASSAMEPDRLHLHSLIFRRWARSWGGSFKPTWMSNAMASVAILLGTLPVMMMATVEASSGWWTGFVMLIAVWCYLFVFSRLVSFHWFSLAYGRRKVGAPQPDL